MSKKIKCNASPLYRAPKFLALEDLRKMTESAIKTHFLGEYKAEPSQVDRFDVLVAYESVGDYGCDSSSWFLLREKGTGALFEVVGSHCSCDGFEDQFTPEPTSVEYLKSDKFSFSMGGYASNLGVEQVKSWIQQNL